MRADFIIAWAGVILQQRLRAHDHPSDAVAALCRLFVYKGLLDRARFFRAAKTLDRHYLTASKRSNRQQARKHRAAVHHDGAGATLPQATPELGGVELEIFAQDIK